MTSCKTFKTKPILYVTSAIFAFIVCSGFYWAPALTNLLRSSASSPPSSLGNWGSITTAFNGDLSHLPLGISQILTGTSVGTTNDPTSGYKITQELAAYSSYLYNSSGNNQSTSSNDGRTGSMGNYAKVDNYGQGDVIAYWCQGYVNATRASATSFLASPQVGCLAGGLTAGANGVLLQGVGDINLTDGGFDVAGFSWNSNLNRTNITGNINANWTTNNNQSTGTKPIDAFARSSGPTRIGMDYSAATFPAATLTTLNMTGGGTGYTVGDLLSPPDGTALQSLKIKVLTINGGGTILTYGIERSGLYSSAPTSPSSVSGGTGSGATFTMAFSTTASPLVVSKADTAWYGNATQDTSVYDTSFPSTVKLGTSFIYYSSGLSAWNIISGNTSALQAYSTKTVVPQPLSVNSTTTIGSATPVTGNGGELGFAKITASGSAPGAGYAKIAVVCGTNAGTAKIIAYAGTSTTPTTILDNIGAGVTGC